MFIHAYWSQGILKINQLINLSSYLSLIIEPCLEGEHVPDYVDTLASF